MIGSIIGGMHPYVLAAGSAIVGAAAFAWFARLARYYVPGKPRA